jgi:hypothetical protein
MKNELQEKCSVNDNVALDKKTLLGLYPEYTSVLGPYFRPDGRQHVILNNAKAPKGTKDKTKTISYPKALKEVELKEKLKPDETVDHHDRDFTNDKLSNLKVKSKSIHASQDALRVTVKPINCPECSNLFTPNVNQRNKQHAGKGQAGPFCSKVCVGKYGARVRNEGVILERTSLEKTYYRIDK